MEDTGQDGVFHLTHKGKEVNLLKDFGQMNIDETKAAVAVIKALGCPYDATNFKTSGTAVRASLATTMLHRIKGMVPVDASGPETLAAVIQAHQVLDSSGCRVLVEELSKMRLRNFPAENVDEFRLKVIEKCRRIDGCLIPPPDFPALVCECFRHTQSVDFNVESAALYKRANRGEITDWREIVSELTTTYKMLFNRGEWPAATNRKEDIPKPIQAMFSKLEQKFDSKLKQSSSFGNRGQGSQTETRTCHHCGQVGHIKPNCPQLKSGSQTENKSNTGGQQKDKKGGQPTAPSSLPGKKRYEPPADNESHTKKLGDDIWKWCGKCKRWNRGDSAHLTDDHRSKNRNERPPTPPKTAAGRFAAVSDNENAPLVQSTLGYLAKHGRTTHKDDIHWCATCNRWVHKLESHCHSVEHSHGRGILLLQRGLQNLSSTCVTIKDEAGQH
jgi:hypothetical protein